MQFERIRNARKAVVVATPSPTVSDKSESAPPVRQIHLNHLQRLKMDNMTGLSLIAEGTSLTDQGIDIITIHGLGGYHNWKHPKHGFSDGSGTVFWVRDFLPTDLPSARIFTFSYHSSALCDEKGINRTTEKLLEKLKNLQKDSIEELSASVLSITAASKTTELTMGAVKLMEQILFGFASLPQHSVSWRIVHCYEELPLPGTNVRAVDPGQGEPWALPPVSLYSHHLDLCRFKTQKDLSYIKVLQSLRNLTSELSSSAADEIAVHTTLSPAEDGENYPSSNRCRFLTQETEVLESLQTEDVWDNVPDASQGTCNWILDHDAYKSWLETPSGFLWITGKAGTGKSTLMKYIIETYRQQNPPNWIVTHFFFRTGTSQSMTSLLSSLIYQLLKTTPATQTFEIFSDFVKKREHQGSGNIWDTDILTQSLLRLADKLTALGDSLFFFIDGLDECDDPGKVVDIFQRLNAFIPSRRTGICISSRPSNSFMPVAEIRMEDNNQFDIKRYLANRLLVLEDRLPPTLDIQKITQTLTEKADGMFLWGSLMVYQLSCDSYLRPLETEKHLTPWLPTSLEAAYETILRRLWSSQDGSRRKVVQDALILVLCAQRPLSILELQSALAGTHSDFDLLTPKVGLQATQWDVGLEINNIHERIPLDMADQLMILCGGLLEVTFWPPKSAKGTTSAAKSTVNFIHQTVRTFLWEKVLCIPESDSCYSESTYSEGHQYSQGFQLLEWRTGKDRNARYHFRVAWMCLLYVNGMGARFHLLKGESTISSAPFLAYSLSFGMLHLNLAKQKGVTPMTENLLQFPPFQERFIRQWTSLHGLIFKNQKLFQPGKTKAVHIMSYYGFPWLDSGLWGAKLTDIKEEDHYGRTPLSFAAAMGHRNICEFLLCKGADTSHRDHVYGQTPLSFAAAHGHKDVVELLLSHGSDYNDYISGVTPLWLASRAGHLEVVDLLLRAGANPKATSIYTGETCLSRAAALGHARTTYLLLKHGAEVDALDKTGWTPLHHAVSRGRKNTIQVLLSFINPHQLHRLKDSFSKGTSKSSWVATVLRALILWICYQRGGESQTPPASTQNTLRPSPNTKFRTIKKEGRSRRKHKLDEDTDEDDCKEDERGVPGKRPCGSNLRGRRLACPYHKKNPARHPGGSCNGIGFETRSRLRTHMYKIHDLSDTFRRCPNCKRRMQVEEYDKTHMPCGRQETHPDYEEGFDQDQAAKLRAIKKRHRDSSDEEYWREIFKALFPDWPQNEDVPSPYQETNVQALSTNYNHAIQQHCDRLLDPSTISSIAGQGPDQIRDQIEHMLRLLVQDVEKYFEDTPITIRNLPAGSIPPVPSEQPTVANQDLEPLSFTSPPERPFFGLDGSFDSASQSAFSYSTVSTSDANSSQPFQRYDHPDMYTEDTATSDQMSTNFDCPFLYHNLDSSRNPAQLQHQMAAPVRQQSTDNMSYNLEPGFPAAGQHINLTDFQLGSSQCPLNHPYTWKDLDQSDPNSGGCDED
ncbi:ankyrin repeat domain protein [Fusarium beomiforme]|uniref:Ankyrin repeat domain protein n=1 Tax=Fusarium beomiforme TaxID=44412 RepID=A0A9P5DTZ4_9HYPO|nr:ankyrin repeat domain protein [Fusarium beomiforme]